MPHVYSIIHESAFSPEMVKIMGEAFDQAWDAVEPDFGGQRDVDIELARLELAKAVVLFAGLGNTDSETLMRKALRVLGDAARRPNNATQRRVLPEVLNGARR